MFQIDIVCSLWSDNEDCRPYWRRRSQTIQADTKEELITKVAREKYLFLGEQLTSRGLPRLGEEPHVRIGPIHEVSPIGALAMEEITNTSYAASYHRRVKTLEDRKAQEVKDHEAREREQLARLKAKYDE